MSTLFSCDYLTKHYSMVRGNEKRLILSLQEEKMMEFGVTTKQDWQLLNLNSNISATASRWICYKKLLWHFKCCRLQIEIVSYWFTIKQLMFNQDPLSQDMRFLFAFPY